MMKSSDILLQESIERDRTGTTNGPDALAYKIVFNALEKQPSFSLHPSFAEKIIQKIKDAKEGQSHRRDLIWLGVGLCAFIMASIFVILVTNLKFTLGVFTFLSNYGGLVFFAIVLVGVLQLVEKILLKRIFF
ncbi:MAG: hypothetical protein RLN86_07885 [Cyclobacteriaceae bacterium]